MPTPRHPHHPGLTIDPNQANGNFQFRNTSLSSAASSCFSTTSSNGYRSDLGAIPAQSMPSLGLYKSASPSINLTYGMPAFPGSNVSIFERAGFDVNKGDSSGPPHSPSIFSKLSKPPVKNPVFVPRTSSATGSNHSIHRLPIPSPDINREASPPPPVAGRLQEEQQPNLPPPSITHQRQFSDASSTYSPVPPSNESFPDPEPTTVPEPPKQTPPLVIVPARNQSLRRDTQPLNVLSEEQTVEEEDEGPLEQPTLPVIELPRTRPRHARGMPTPELTPDLSPYHQHEFNNKHTSMSSQSSSNTVDQRTGRRVPESPPRHDPKYCRGCNQLITGKALRSKDGKLSGRWHKQCFECNDCGELLSSQQHVDGEERGLYVWSNMPLCRGCYHTRNESCCGQCQLPIEGLCVENEDKVRFHIDCLKCNVCNTELCDEYYFELNGKPICDEHAAEFKDNKNNVNKRKSVLERRRTRLLTMKGSENDPENISFI